MTTYNIHGTTDEITTCACCGKKNLRNTVILEIAEGDNAGDLLHFGSHCAARALGQRKTKAAVIVSQAKRRAQLQPIVDVVKANIDFGIDHAKAQARAFAKANKIDALINGFESWGQINIHGNGIDVTVTA